MHPIDQRLQADKWIGNLIVILFIRISPTNHVSDIVTKISCNIHLLNLLFISFILHSKLLLLIIIYHHLLVKHKLVELWFEIYFRLLIMKLICIIFIMIALIWALNLLIGYFSDKNPFNFPTLNYNWLFFLP